MKKKIYLTTEEFKKEVDKIVDASAESLRKKLKQIKKNKERLYV